MCIQKAFVGSSCSNDLGEKKNQVQAKAVSERWSERETFKWLSRLIGQGEWQIRWGARDGKQKRQVSVEPII